MADKLKDIDHTPPYGTGANTVWARGNEDEAVEAAISESDAGSPATSDD